jgi:hypothetical protein
MNKGVFVGVFLLLIATMAFSASILQVRRDLAVNWTAANPTLHQGEIGLEIDTLKIKFGDGATAWNALAYYSTSISSSYVVTTVNWDNNFLLRKDINFTKANFDSNFFTLFKPNFDSNFSYAFDRNLSTVFALIDQNRGRIDTNVNTWRKTDTNSIVS